MSFRSRIFVTFMLLSVLSAGCGRGIKEGVYAITGSSGKVTLLQGQADRISNLAYEYGSFSVGQFNNEVGAVCPEQFINELPGAIEDELRYRKPSVQERLTFKDGQELGPFFTGPADKNLIISGRIIQYEAGDMLDKAAGPMDEAICRIRIIDQSGQLLAEANCVGRAKSAVRTGPGELAEGVAKAIAKLLKPKKLEN